MKKVFSLLAVVLALLSCGRNSGTAENIISVSIAPFKYFVEEIAGENFTVNVMVPPGADPHIYEPYPEQINRLRKSVAYISNGYLGFEMAWLERFYEINRSMKRLSLGNFIEPLVNEEHHHGDRHSELADPHYWMSPACARDIATAIRDFISGLDPQNTAFYNENFEKLLERINFLDNKARELAELYPGRPFMIYHPNLAYFARDYGFEEIPVEYDGKEPAPSRLKKLIDRAKTDQLRVVMVQKEYDTKNARALADETGARVVMIDPLSEDWYSSMSGIIDIIREGFE